MFVGRERGVRQLDRMYVKSGFQMAVVYGRRRAGKTTLIDAFAKDKPTLCFTAQQRSSLQNLAQLSRVVYSFFGLPEDAGAFPDWRSAFVCWQTVRNNVPAVGCSQKWGRLAAVSCVVVRTLAGCRSARKKAETDIDLIAADKESKSILLGECKRRNSFNESKAIELLEHRATLVKGYEHRSFCLFTRNPASEAARKKAESRLDLKLVSVADMFPGR